MSIIMIITLMIYRDMEFLLLAIPRICMCYGHFVVYDVFVAGEDDWLSELHNKELVC